MLNQLSATQLRRAADLKDRIESAEKQLARLLGAPAAAAVPAKAKRQPRAAKSAGRPATIAGMVREILARAARPMSLDGILTALADRGRPLRPARNARKMFATNLYQMAGVKRVGRGLFAAGK